MKFKTGIPYWPIVSNSKYLKENNHKTARKRWGIKRYDISKIDVHLEKGPKCFSLRFLTKLKNLKKMKISTVDILHSKMPIQKLIKNNNRLLFLTSDVDVCLASFTYPSQRKFLLQLKRLRLKHMGLSGGFIDILFTEKKKKRMYTEQLTLFTYEDNLANCKKFDYFTNLKSLKIQIFGFNKDVDSKKYDNLVNFLKVLSTENKLKNTNIFTIVLFYKIGATFCGSDFLRCAENMIAFFSNAIKIKKKEENFNKSLIDKACFYFLDEYKSLNKLCDLVKKISIFPIHIFDVIGTNILDKVAMTCDISILNDKNKYLKRLSFTTSNKNEIASSILLIKTELAKVNVIYRRANNINNTDNMAVLNLTKHAWPKLKLKISIFESSLGQKDIDEMCEFLTLIPEIENLKILSKLHRFEEEQYKSLAILNNVQGIKSINLNIMSNLRVISYLKNFSMKDFLNNHKIEKVRFNNRTFCDMDLINSIKNKKEVIYNSFR